MFWGSSFIYLKNTQVVQVGVTRNSITNGNNKDRWSIQGDSPSVLVLGREGNLLL